MAAPAPAPADGVIARPGVPRPSAPITSVASAPRASVEESFGELLRRSLSLRLR